MDAVTVLAGVLLGLGFLAVVWLVDALRRSPRGD